MVKSILIMFLVLEDLIWKGSFYFLSLLFSFFGTDIWYHYSVFSD